MTREELKEHCVRQIAQFETMKKIKAVSLLDWKHYEEHKLVLELLEQSWIPVSSPKELPYDCDLLVTHGESDNAYVGTVYWDMKHWSDNVDDVTAYMRYPKPYDSWDTNDAAQNIRDCNKVSEQDIIKPYLEQLRQEMKERDDDNGGEPLNAVDRGYHLAYEHLCEEIDKLLSEVKKKNEHYI